MVDKMVENLEKSTGVKLEEWLKRVKTSGLEKHMEKVKHLKTEYGLTHGYANLIVHTAKSGLPSKETSADAGAELLVAGTAVFGNASKSDLATETATHESRFQELTKLANRA